MAPAVRTIQAWIAATGDMPVAGHVTDHLRAAQALYEGAGFRLVSIGQANWTTPGGGPVILHRYAWSHSLHDERPG